MAMTRKPCQDSGAYAPYAYREGRPAGRAWCGCCGHTVRTETRQDDPNSIPHYVSHGMSGHEYR